MTTQIALLRGVNVGGANRIAMPVLKGLLAELGLLAPRTLLQSGNAVFESDDPGGAVLEARLEAALEKRLGLKTAIHLRTAGQWAQMVAANPFATAATAEPSRLVVMFLKQPPAPGAVEALRASITGPEQVEARGREAYILFPDGMGRSKLAPARLDRALGAGGTGRNWNTVRKLADMARAPSA